MNYGINKESNTPAYIQLYRQLRRAILDGDYPYGSKLPSKRVLAADTGVSVITVEHAVSLLCEEGYTENRQRSGCYVIFRKSDFNGEPAVSDGRQASSLKPHNTGDFPYTVLAKTMRRVILDYGERILIKSPNHGCPELRNEICAYLGRSRSMHVEPSQIIIGSGAEYLYGLVAQLFGRETVFALESPSYDKIRKVYESFGNTCEMLTLGTDGINSEELKKSKASVLHTTPFNSFPSGISVGISKKLEYLNWATERSGMIIEDNYDSELTVSGKPEDSLFSMSESGNVIYVNTFSKTIAPSMRIGYMVLPKHMADTFNEKLGFYSCTVPVFDQYVLAELLRGGDYERHVNRVRRRKRKAMQEKNPD